MGWPKNKGLRLFFERAKKTYLLIDTSAVCPDGAYECIGELYSDLRKYQRALKVLEESRKWIPKLVKAMYDSGEFGTRFPHDVELIVTGFRITALKEKIKTEIQKEALLHKYHKLLIPGNLYELHAGNTPLGLMILVKIIRFNKESVKIQLLASSENYNFPFELIQIQSNKTHYLFWENGLSDVTKVTKVDPKSLHLYISMNPTEHFAKLLKGDQA